MRHMLVWWDSSHQPLLLLGERKEMEDFDMGLMVVVGGGSLSMKNPSVCGSSERMHFWAKAPVFIAFWRNK